MFQEPEILTFVEGSSFDDTLGGVKEAHFWSRVIDLIRSFDDPNDSNDPLVRVSENWFKIIWSGNSLIQGSTDSVS